MESFLTIGQLAKRSGVAASALRFYEARGLIRADRASSGHRRYPRSMLRRVAFIVFARRIGMSLDEIRAELDKLPSDQVPSGEDWAKLSGPWTARIDARIAELQRIKAGLSECIGCGCLSLRSCELLNPSDEAADGGAGPRYWVGEGDAAAEPSEVS
ncbi:redox-sensitive transcriptional activator SoxR [Algiphilus aromaticivorans]|uniref:redox-sensitive transcriptional activator SoxR n=1 Tax=Algiphilus aromaticivorans TaxID=382454 RepID=UPI0005C20746|nr:redox-sensitive transcriptional activator SoxR [Algiphilus aromaticivorans]